MNKKILKKFQNAVMQHHDAILEMLNAGLIDTYVHLNNRIVNHRATSEMLPVLPKIKETLDRIESGEFGTCELCKGQVETERLELDYTTCICLDHYTKSELRSLEQDLEMEARVQQQLLPCSVPALADFDFAVHSKPAEIVSGDYYDFYEYANGKQGVVIADVMGKGISASMLMSNLQASLRILGPEHEDLASLTMRLNELFCYNLKLIRFISLFLAVIDPRTGFLHYCNAGHHPPILNDAQSQSLKWLNPTGPAIGLVHNPVYGMNSVKLNSGDMLVLYTDGLVEMRSLKGEEFGEDRLAAYVHENAFKSAQGFMSGLFKDIRDFASTFHDDMTIMVIKKR